MNDDNMDESGISLGFDLDDFNAIISDEFLEAMSPPDSEPLNFYQIISRPAPLSESPSIKTEAVKSRTQLKQQLMRDQLQLQKERKKMEVEKVQPPAAKSNAKVPINLQNVALPQNVLQVRTGLQNPTKYHILEKQKNQVLQFLSTSQQGSALPDRSAIVQSTTKPSPKLAQKQSTSYRVLPPVPSPSIHSVTSGGASDAEDVLEGILSYEETDAQGMYGSNASLERFADTSSCPSGMSNYKQEPYTGSEDNAKDRIKKDTHNMIERRRRYNINDRIKELGDLLPQRNELHYDMVRDSRSNKGTILKSSVDYIKMLKNDVTKMKQMEYEKRQLQAENRKLLLRIQQLEIQARAKGVALKEETWKVKDPSEIIEEYIRPGPNPRRGMPDLVSEAVYVQYDESVEDVPLPDPVLGTVGLLPHRSPYANDVDMEMSLMRGAVAHDSVDRTSDVTLSENTTFADLLLSKAVLQGLHAAGFRKPSPIQLSAIPLGRLGKDLILQAKSGTGKTLVFTIVALEMIDLSICKPQVLILAPTREIAVQIKEVITSVGAEFPGLKVGVFIGGLSVAKDIAAAESCHIVVGTPGRIRMLIAERHLKVESVRLFVLDEADRLVDESFRLDVRFIFCKLPEYKQTLVVSATFPPLMEAFLSKLLISPLRIQPSVSSLLLGIRHYVLVTPKHTNVVVRVRHKTAAVVRILSSIPLRQCLIFCNVQSKMEGISRNLSSKGWPTIHLAGSMPQQDRLAALSALQNQRCRILLTTDLAARGIDVEQVDVVINMDLPYDSETFLHRIGRAGRYGAKAIAISIVEDGQELTAFQHLLFDIGGPEYRVQRLPPGDWPSQIWNGESPLDYLESVPRPKVEDISYESSHEGTVDGSCENSKKTKIDLEVGTYNPKISTKSERKAAGDTNRTQSEGENKISVEEASAALRQLFITSDPKPPFSSYTEIHKLYEVFKAFGDFPSRFQGEIKSESLVLEHDKLLAAMKALNLGYIADGESAVLGKGFEDYASDVDESSDDDDGLEKCFEDYASDVDESSDDDDGLYSDDENGDSDVSLETNNTCSSDNQSSYTSSYQADNNRGIKLCTVGSEKRKAQNSACECRTCNDWFREWRQQLRVQRQIHQRQIYMEEMLK